MANILVTGWHDGALSVLEERDDKASMLREVSPALRTILCMAPMGATSAPYNLPSGGAAIHLNGGVTGRILPARKLIGQSRKR